MGPELEDAIQWIKMKVLHIRKNNPRYGYQMNGVNLEVSDKEKDVGVMIQEDLKPFKQCTTAAAKANSILGQMARSFSYRNKTMDFIILILYQAPP